MRGEGNYGNWTTVKIPGPGHHETVLETSWILSNLSATASYECIIQVCQASSVSERIFLWTRSIFTRMGNQVATLAIGPVNCDLIYRESSHENQLCKNSCL